MTTQTVPDRQSAAPKTAGAIRPLKSLAIAEYRQFIRNKTLIINATTIPVGISLVLFFLIRNNSGTSAELAASTLESFALAGLIFVVFYSVLSMVTTRRGEGVLKRLRTGEAADWQILTAPGLPTAGLTLIGFAIVSAVVYGFGSPAPVNPIPILIAILSGIVLFTLLALTTSAYTKNAEAAQITSLPVMIVAILGMTTIRGVLPERFASIVEWTPFAAIGDLISLGAAGKLATADESVAALDFAGTITEMGTPIAVLAVWCAVAITLTVKGFRWSDRG